MNFQEFISNLYGIEYGKGEIKNFSPQIKNILRVANPLNIHQRKTMDIARKMGFVVKKCSGIAYVGETQVLKNCFIWGDEGSSPPPHIRIPTLSLRKEGRFHFVIQPRAYIPPSRKEREYIAQELIKIVEKYPNTNTLDIHEGNVGEYKGKFVLMDW